MKENCIDATIQFVAMVPPGVPTQPGSEVGEVIACGLAGPVENRWNEVFIFDYEWILPKVAKTGPNVV
jgi:hypothetical protein